MHHQNLSRRTFLGVCLAGSAAMSGCAVVGRASHSEIIDTHTHFYDPSRPEGVPWPGKDDAVLYRTVLPAEYKKLAQPFGITGTVVVEASPRVEDNAWVLDLAAKEPFLRGLVGHLKPGKPGFENDLTSFAKNPRFRGMRTGLWDIPLAPENTPFVRDLGLLADRGLALDVLGGPDQINKIAQLADALPKLNIVIDHCAGVRIDGKAPPSDWVRGLKEVAKRPNINMKVSGLVEGTNKPGAAPTALRFYRPTLDIICEAFGEDRVIFGSNWPVSERFAPFATVFQLVDSYFSEKGAPAKQKYFAGNAKRVYAYV